MKKFWLLVMAVVLMLSASRALGTQLIVNGGFETGDLTGWGIAGDFPVLGAYPAPNIWPGHSELGNWVAGVNPPTIFGLQAIGTAALFQNFIIPGAAPVVDVSFQYFPWSFDSIQFDWIRIGMFYDTGGGASFDEYLYWGGTDFGTLETPGWQAFQRYYDVSGITSPIACTIAFGVTTTNDILYPTGLFVDNVSVEVVPEPATLLLLGGGLLGMGAIGSFRRRKK